MRGKDPMASSGRDRGAELRLHTSHLAELNWSCPVIFGGVPRAASLGYSLQAFEEL